MVSSSSSTFCGIDAQEMLALSPVSLRAIMHTSPAMSLCPSSSLMGTPCTRYTSIAVAGKTRQEFQLPREHLQLPVVILPAGSVAVPAVYLDPELALLQSRLQALGLLDHAGALLFFHSRSWDRNDDYLRVSHPRWQHQPLHMLSCDVCRLVMHMCSEGEGVLTLSSPCTMIMTPMDLVDSPQEFCHTSRRSASSAS